MKIAHLELNNYRGIGHLEITPKGKVNVIIGHCGAGKSSILDALKFVLTGTVSCDDIKVGQDNCLVGITLEDGTKISRKRNMDKTEIRVNGKVTTQKACNSFIEEKFGCNVDVLESMCGSDFLESISQKDLSKFIQDILPISFSLEKLMEFSEEYLGMKLEEDEKEYLSSKFGNLPIINLSDIESEYNNAFSERKVKKAAYKEMESKVKFDITTLPKESVEELSRELQSINIAEAKSLDYDKNLKAYEKSIRDNAAVVEKKKQLEEMLKTYSSVTEPDKELLNTYIAERKQFIDAIAKTNSVYATNQANIKLFENTLKNLNSQVCPISSKLICSTDKTALKEELEELIEKNKVTCNECEEFIRRCNEQVEKRDALIEDYNKAVTNWNNKKNIEMQIENLIIPQILECPVKPDNEGYGEKKNEIISKLTIHSTYQSCLSFSAKFSVLMERIELLNRMMNILKGVPNVIIAKTLAPLESIVNEKAEILRKGFTIKLSGPDGLDVRIAPRGDHFIPMNKVSSGEFIFTAYLIMSAIHQITGASILIIDNIDKLDNESAKAFISLLMSQNEFENIFIAGVDHEDTVKNIDELGTNVIRM